MKRGIKCVAYRNTGTYASPTWTALNLFANFQINQDWNTVFASFRGNAVRVGDVTDMNLEITASVRSSDTDADYIALWTAFIGASVVDLLVLNAAKTVVGARGMRFDAKFASHNEDQGAGSLLIPEMKIIPTDATTDPLAVPSYAVVGAGPVLAFTPIAA